jgi:alpha-ketoglutarate-dependent taurine dioxygenase
MIEHSTPGPGATVIGPVVPGRSMPFAVRPTGPRSGLGLAAWVAESRGWLRDQLLTHGALLLREFDGVTAESFEAAVRAVFGEPLDYTERSSPRHSVHRNVYTSTDHPAQERIYLHNEQSYNLVWPLRICFCCLVPARDGGSTPVADCRRIYQRVPARIRERFADVGYLYVRNFGSGLGLDWQEAFQATDPAEVDRYCAANDIEAEWLSAHELRTRQRRPAVSQHPQTGEWVWFNHITFFHVSTLGAEVAEALVEALGPDQLPNNTYYGDGSEIEPAVLDELRAAYEAELIEFRWHAGDVLLLDNMLTAHGRAPFQPPRQVVVTMAEPCSATARQ